MTRALENWELHSVANYCQDMDVFPDLVFGFLVFFPNKIQKSQYVCGIPSCF